MKNLLPSTTHPRTEIQTSLEGLCQGILLEIHPLGYWRACSQCLTRDPPLQHAWGASCWPMCTTAAESGEAFCAGRGCWTWEQPPVLQGPNVGEAACAEEAGLFWGGGGTLDSEEPANLIHWSRNKPFFPQCLSSALYWESLTYCQLQGGKYFKGPDVLLSRHRGWI